MITCRPARVEDLEATDALVISSINDLTERHGFGRMASRSPPRFQAFCLKDDPRGLWTSEEDGAPVGFAWSWACADFWFLAQLFVKPDLQARGTGRELLRRTLEHADLVGARQRTLITFAFNTVSQGLYIRHGFVPRFPIYSMSTPRERLARQLAPSARDVRPLVGSDGEFLALGGVDLQALGVSREKHHRLLSEEPGIRALGLHEGGRLVGYAYVSAGGRVGPLAVASPHLVQEMLRAALALAAEGASEIVSCFMPGSNEQALRHASEAGMRITFPMLMMTTEEIGTWPCYMPRNPGFM